LRSVDHETDGQLGGGEDRTVAIRRDGPAARVDPPTPPQLAATTIPTTTIAATNLGLERVARRMGVPVKQDRAPQRDARSAGQPGQTGSLGTVVGRCSIALKPPTGRPERRRYDLGR
jgi:hypothetical protein